MILADIDALRMASDGLNVAFTPKIANQVRVDFFWMKEFPLCIARAVQAGPERLDQQEDCLELSSISETKTFICSRESYTL
ncbi:hypothetical protein LWI29_014684 [Acer saccharum]|uniref:Uncharacterized protein n=1 Tax=Acer saccharum TaxID=4024 RepID=A0AA39STC8_ACESA|nr:hypothetical protein LWI29_014684 [Acer saccharum]